MIKAEETNKTETEKMDVEKDKNCDKEPEPDKELVNTLEHKTMVLLMIMKMIESDLC